MKRTYSITAIALTGIMGLGVITAPMAAQASEQGKRNTAYALGAAAAALLLTQHNKLPGLLAAGGAAYAFSQVNNDGHARYRRNDYGSYDNEQNNRRNDNDRYNRNRQNDQSNHDNGSHYRQNDSGNNGASEWRNQNSPREVGARRSHSDR